MLKTWTGPRLNGFADPSAILHLTGDCLLFHENGRHDTINTSSFVIFRMAGCNIIQKTTPASVSKKLECKILQHHALCVMQFRSSSRSWCEKGVTHLMVKQRLTNTSRKGQNSRTEIREWEGGRERESSGSGSITANYKMKTHGRGINVWNAVSNMLMETNTHP